MNEGLNLFQLTKKLNLVNSSKKIRVIASEWDERDDDLNFGIISVRIDFFPFNYSSSQIKNIGINTADSQNLYRYPSLDRKQVCFGRAYSFSFCAAGPSPFRCQPNYKPSSISKPVARRSMHAIAPQLHSLSGVFFLVWLWLVKYRRKHFLDRLQCDVFQPHWPIKGWHGSLHALPHSVK